MTAAYHHALPVGTKIGPYEVQGVLGIGGFGITYKAYDGTLERLVAVKEYLPSSLAIRTLDKVTVTPKSEGDNGDYQYGLKRFLDEARTLAKFAEPNIVRVINYLEANGTAYFVMDYEEGECLDTHLKSEISLPVEKIRDISVPLLKGLRTVHAHQFLHRDIKPLNIYLRRSGSPVLLDFGAARQAVNTQARTMTGMVTPGYAPFEQYLNDGTQGPWTDIYAMGATIYHCAIGLTPTISTERIAALHAGQPDPVRSQGELLERKVGREFTDLIMWMLGPMPNERPQSVDEVLAAFDGRTQPPPYTETADGDMPGSWTAAVPTTVPQETLEILERNLQQHIGPLSRVLVRRVATQARNVETLTEMLARFIDSDTARNAFIKQSRTLSTEAVRHSGPNSAAGRHPPRISGAPTTIDPARIEHLERRLGEHVGPIARVLVRKAVARARNEKELREILAQELKDPAERAVFLSECERV